LILRVVASATAVESRLRSWVHTILAPTPTAVLLHARHSAKDRWLTYTAAIYRVSS